MPANKMITMQTVMLNVYKIIIKFKLQYEI